MLSEKIETTQIQSRKSNFYYKKAMKLLNKFHSFFVEY